MVEEFVAEVTTNHMGNLNVLLAMVDAAKAAGATSLKMQKKDVETFYSQAKLDAPFASPYGTTYREYRKMFEFSIADWNRFDRRCFSHRLPWFGTGQDLPSVEFLEMCRNMQRYKVSSSNARNLNFLRSVASIVGKESEIVLSVAGSTLPEIEAALEVFRDFKKIWLLHCVAIYPCPFEDWRLGNIPELIKRFQADRIRIGYSGHEVGWQASVAAAKMGAEMIERHFCLSRHSFVHHIECSLTPSEFAAMRHAIAADVTPGDPKRVGHELQGSPGLIGSPCAAHIKPSPELAQVAYRTEFGMSDAEKLFLERQTYATDRLGVKSGFESGGVRSREAHERTVTRQESSDPR